MNVNCLGVIGYILGMAGAAMLGGSMGTPYWQSGNSTWSGLFQICVESNCEDIGWSIDNKIGIAILICRVMLFASCVLCGIGFVIGTASFCQHSNIKTAGGHHVSCGILILLGCASYISLMVLYVGRDVPTFDSYGVSFYLCWASGASLILAGILEMRGRRETSTQVHPHHHHHRRTRQQIVWSSQRENERQPPTNPYYHDA